MPSPIQVISLINWEVALVEQYEVNTTYSGLIVSHISLQISRILYPPDWKRHLPFLIWRQWYGQVPLQRGLIYHITFGAAMTATECKSEFELTTDTPYLTLTGQLWGVYVEYFEEIDHVITALHCIEMSWPFLSMWRLCSRSFMP